MKLGYAINYAKRIRPGSAFPDEVYIQWINQIEGLVQTDVWMLFAEDVLSYHENAEKGGTGVSFPDDKTLRFESDPGFYAGGEVVLSGFSTYAANNASAARTILKRSADGLSYEFAEGTFATTGTEPEESATAAVSYTEYEKELLVPKPHDKLYLSYLLAMIDLANAETRNYANSITVFNEDYQEYSGYYGLNVNPADGRAEFKGYYISAYSIARKNGFTGTEREWLKSLEGSRGADGAPGAPVVIRDMYGTLDELRTAVTTPNLGDMYAVGTESENVVYFWNGTTWVGLGAVKGADGAPGANGADGVGISSVAFKETDASGNNVYTITLTNGATYDFTAPKGAKGAKGSKGDTGATGPNSVSTSTATNITGILKGNGSTVAAAVAGTDYAAPDHTHSYIPASEKAAASGVASLDADTKVTASQASAAVVNVSASTTLSSSHAGRFLSCTNASGITITIPTGIAAGTEIEIYRGGAGTVTLSPASGVTVECKEASYGIADQYTSVVLKWRTDSIVVLEGNVG